MAERIMRQARRLNALIGELLDASRIQDDVLELKNEENVDLVEVTRRVIDAYATTGREIKQENATKKLVGKWDEVRLEQVLHNLLSNALKYSPENTSVSVRLERKKNEAVVSIKDQGSGLSKEEQEHIFDRYYRVSRDAKSKVEGLGLGLYIAQNIIAGSGGRMWVESKPGEGSTFSFALPLIKVDDKSRGY